jgi:hypothetical protein
MELDDLQAKLKEAISTLSDEQLAEVADFVRFVKTAQSSVWEQQFTSVDERNQAVFEAFKLWQAQN